jgi:hypothetical protein
MPDFQRLPKRRSVIQAGAAAAFGLNLPQVLAQERGTVSTKARAKHCIILFMWGGPSQLDTWDLKPSAPEEIRGDFKPISTNVPGIQISEHFPLLAKQANRYAIIRSMAHDDPAHLSSVHHLLTGRHAPKPKSDADAPSRKDTPHLGSMMQQLRPVQAAMPSFITVPWTVSHPAAPGGQAPGQHAGWLGMNYDPFTITGDPNARQFSPPGMEATLEAGISQLEDRRALLQSVDHATVGLPNTPWHERAFNLLTSESAKKAFDLSQESQAVRDRYGRHTHGQSCLLARRLIEAGVRVVQVNWPHDGQNFWDTHTNNFGGLKGRLMPPADRGFSALLEDLEVRGLLDETMVVWVGEFGRAPKINKAVSGREHWPRCYSAVVAGAGIHGGQVIGRSDSIAAYPSVDPYTPANLTASIYQAFGIDPQLTVHDRERRPQQLTEAEAIQSLWI